MRRFQVQPDKSISDPRGQRARIVMVQAFPNVMVLEDPVRNDWSIRGSVVPENANIVVQPGQSKPTGFARHSWRSPARVAALIASYHEAGFRGIRTGIDPGMLKVPAYVDPDDGRSYPSEMDMLDTMVDVASQYGWMINLTMACSYAPVNVVAAFLGTMAARYKDNGHVVFNPSNEINCGNGSGQCGNATLWASTMATYIAAIRDAGAKNLILLNPTGNATGNPSSGWSMNGILGVIGSAPFTTDPNLAYGIHHYRYPGDPPGFDPVQEDAKWGSLLSTYPIVVEECGIGTDFVNFYDPDMSEEPSHDAAEWEKFKAEHAGFLSYCRDKMDNGPLSLVCVGLDSAFIDGKHIDLTMRRTDGTWTTQGEMVRQHLLGPAWSAVMAQALPNTGGSDVNGQDFRVIVPGSVFTSAYSRLRVTIKAPSAYGVSFSDMFVGPAAAAGDVYDTAAMTRIKTSGGCSLTMAAGTSRVLDEIALSGAAGQGLVFAFQVAGPTRSSLVGPGVAGFTVARKLGGNASLANAPSDYTVDTGYCAFIAKIEVAPC